MIATMDNCNEQSSSQVRPLRRNSAFANIRLRAQTIMAEVKVVQQKVESYVEKERNKETESTSSPLDKENSA